MRCSTGNHFSNSKWMKSEYDSSRIRIIRVEMEEVLPSILFNTQHILLAHAISTPNILYNADNRRL